METITFDYEDLIQIALFVLRRRGTLNRVELSGVMRRLRAEHFEIIAPSGTINEALNGMGDEDLAQVARIRDQAGKIQHLFSLTLGGRLQLARGLNKRRAFWEVLAWLQKEFPRERPV